MSNSRKNCCFRLFARKKKTTSHRDVVIDLPNKDPVKIGQHTPSETEKEPSSEKAIREPSSLAPFDDYPRFANLISPTKDVHLLGDGSSCRVFKVTWGDKTFAIKRIKTKLDADEYRDGISELHILMTLKHANIVKCHGYSSTTIDKNKINFDLVMDCLPDGSLYDYIKKHPDAPFDWDKRYRLLHQVACALAYVHHSGLIHRDVKSKNILLDLQNERALLCDFGLSIKSTAFNTNIAGTLSWVGCELVSASSRVNTIAMDIYSFSIVMWEAANWTEPHRGLSNDEIYRFVASGRREPINEKCPTKISALIRNGWHVNPSARLSSQHIAEELSTPIEACSNRLLSAEIYSPRKLSI